MMLSASAMQSFATSMALTPTAASVTDVYQRYNDSRNGAVYNVVEPITTIKPAKPSQTIEYDVTRRHQFISLPWTADIINGQNEAFGKVTVVQRETPEATSGNNYKNGYTPPVGVDYANAINSKLERDNKALHMYREVQAREQAATASVKLVSTLCLINEEGEIQRINGSGEKGILRCFPGQATKLLEYKQSNKLFWVKSEDIVRLLVYGNSLQEL